MKDVLLSLFYILLFTGVVVSLGSLLYYIWNEDK